MKRLIIKISGLVGLEVEDDITEDKAQELAWLLFDNANKDDIEFDLDGYMITSAKEKNNDY